MLFKHVVSALIFWLFADSVSINAAAPGFLEGQLKIVSLREEVEPSDEMPRQIVTTKRYAQYSLIILSQEQKKEIARVTADENGNYRVGLHSREIMSSMFKIANSRVKYIPLCIRSRGSRSTFMLHSPIF